MLGPLPVGAMHKLVWTKTSGGSFTRLATTLEGYRVGHLHSGSQAPDPGCSRCSESFELVRPTWRLGLDSSRF